jgi:hypothetical protein
VSPNGVEVSEVSPNGVEVSEVASVVQCVEY